jgi:hypothetical protein
MGRRHLLVFALLIFSVAAAHAAWEAWESHGKPAIAGASPGSSKVCTACGMKDAKTMKSPAAPKKPATNSHTVDINGLEPYEVDTPRTPIISPAVEGFVPPPSTRPNN